MPIDEQITLRKLEVFLCFLEHGNMARVADCLGQSTVSIHRSLHSLEEALRCPLFQRDGRRLIPLESAHTLAEYARRALQECAEGIRRTREVAGFSAARLRIGALYSLTVKTLPHLIMGLKSRQPDLDVDLTLGSNRELLHLLREGRIDAVVMAIDTPRTYPDLCVTPLFRDTLFFAAHLQSPYAGREQVELPALAHENYVGLNEDFATFHDSRLAFERAGFVPRVAIRVGDIFSLTNLVSGGVGYALLPGRVAEFNSQVQLIPIAPPCAVHQHIALLIPLNRERDPNLLALAAVCRACRH